MYGVSARLHSRLAGIVAASITAIYPNFIIYNLDVLPRSLGLLLVVFLMYLAVAKPGGNFSSFMSAAINGLGILLNPIFVYLTPGLFAAVKRRISFIIVLAAVLTPWIARNAVVYKKLVPVYEPAVYEFDVRKYSKFKEGWGTVHDLYNSLASIFSRGFIEPLDFGADTVKRNSTYATHYAYIAVMLLGLTGLIRHYRRDHRGAVFPIAGYAVLLTLLSTFELVHRAFLEPMFIVYASILLCGMRRASAPSRTAPDKKKEA
jgi:hypothetical protein